MEIKPQLAKDAPEKPPRLRTGDKWVQEPKLDGWRGLWERTGNGVQLYTGRNGRPSESASPQVLAVKDALMVLPVGTVIDSELIAVGATAPEVASVLAGTPRGRRLELEVWAFDVLKVGTMEVLGLPWDERRPMLETLVEAVGSDFVKLMPYVRPPDPSVHEAWLASGLEGSVCKRIDSKYVPGRRTSDWTKVKPQETTEAIIVGYEMGKGASNGHKVGALEIQLLETGKRTTTAWSGTVEEARRLQGRVCEVRHHGWTEDGKVRHPIWHRLRPDRE